MMKMLDGYYIVSTATSHRFKPFLVGKVDSICGNYRSIPQGWLHPAGALGTKDYSKPCHRCESLQTRYEEAR